MTANKRKTTALNKHKRIEVYQLGSSVNKYLIIDFCWNKNEL